MDALEVVKREDGDEEDDNEVTLQECMRIHKLARSVDELVAWSFIMGEKEMILQELENVLTQTEQELEKAEKALKYQHRRCALIPGDIYMSSERRDQRPHAARGEDRELSALWAEHGSSLTQQYERHLARYKRLWHELLEEPKVTAENIE
ncbi:hypothetical protein TcYC6_0006490 [Trypanosoma cruzi]|nr:hypothetical protein TcYC6_0006490 [Trypanosoma cruzi]RNC37694.1 hypothetical protein TcCL_NonESM13132 [Trypanosoma cruzi]